VGLPTKLLASDEHEVLHTRTHAKALFWPCAALVLVGAAVGAGTAVVPPAGRPLGQLAIALVGVLLVVWWCVTPFLRWFTTTYTLTDRRLIRRSGILTRLSLDLPLSRVVDVSSERSLSDRLFRCGTLAVQTAAEGGTIALVDVPDVEHVHRTMTELLHLAHETDRPAHG
jgi:uncharacterized membrane protein YdbT with pleckstrin-like domain